MNESIVEIHKIIKWLQDNAESNDVNAISVQLNYLSTHSFYFAENVTDAHAAMSDTEDEYKTAVARYIAESKLPAAKSEREAETLYAPLRKKFIEMQNLQRKFKQKLDRIDKVLDHYKQRVSVINKIELKGL